MIFLRTTLPYMTRNARWRSRRLRYRAAAHVPNFATLVPAPELSLSDAKHNPFRKMPDTLYPERHLWSRNESVEIRYMSGSSVAGTSASSPGVPRHMYNFLDIPAVTKLVYSTATTYELDIHTLKAASWHQQLLPNFKFSLKLSL